ncbi:MAG: 8-amino-7-oxononanoate synthase [Actinobacteria bacterium]|nr:MAG: 8-amino-7-oxononanoate synthase [Actinomycetota bacterium]
MRVVTTAWDAFLADELARRDDAGLLRTLRPLERDGCWVVAEGGRRLLDLSSNDYLGLSCHPTVVDAAARAARRRSGATASRLIVGTDGRYAALEEKLADFQGTEAALVFGSGYLANVGAISCLVGPEDAVLSDSLNHASIIDGCRLSRAAIHRYEHRDLDQLEAMLRRAEQAGARRKLIVTETVFSMSGDVAPLAEIVELKERYGAALLVDEAHADGVFGPRGEGYAHELGVAEQVDLHLGTFGKAFGAYGAYIAGSSLWIDYLTNAARSFVFTTSLPPAVIGAVDAALEVIRDADGLRATLLENAARFRSRLQALGLDTCASSTQIVPLVVGESERALALSQALETAGVLVVAIRPPTVPRRTARLRFSVTALHGRADLDRALEAIELTIVNTAAR